MINSDEELFLEWQQGSAGALEALVQRYHAPLIAHFFRLIGDVHTAEDLAQETFLHLVRYTHTYQYPRPFRPWFYTIGRRLALNYHQKAYNRLEESRTELPSMPENVSDLDQWLERLDQRNNLREALSLLSMEQREILSLRFGQEFDVKETATILGIPIGTVKSRTFTALNLLRDYFAASVQKEDNLSGEHTYE